MLGYWRSKLTDFGVFTKEDVSYFQSGPKFTIDLQQDPGCCKTAVKLMHNWPKFFTNQTFHHNFAVQKIQ